MADGLKPSEADRQSEQDPSDLTENSKLWLGKDYSNFIRKDWVQLDKPFEGISCDVYLYHTNAHMQIQHAVQCYHTHCYSATLYLHCGTLGDKYCSFYHSSVILFWSIFVLHWRYFRYFDANIFVLDECFECRFFSAIFFKQYCYYYLHP